MTARKANQVRIALLRRALVTVAKRRGYRSIAREIEARTMSIRDNFPLPLELPFLNYVLKMIGEIYRYHQGILQIKKDKASLSYRKIVVMKIRKKYRRKKTPYLVQRKEKANNVLEQLLRMKIRKKYRRKKTPYLVQRKEKANNVLEQLLRQLKHDLLSVEMFSALGSSIVAYTSQYMHFALLELETLDIDHFGDYMVGRLLIKGYNWNGEMRFLLDGKDDDCIDEITQQAVADGLFLNILWYHQ